MARHRCRKTPYTKQEAKRQSYFRNLKNGENGSTYYCDQHKAWHVTRHPSPITDKMWQYIKHKHY